MRFSAGFCSIPWKGTDVGWSRKVAYAQNIAQYFVLAASLGIPNYGIREIARRRKDEEQTKELFSSLFFINLISTLICTALYYALILESAVFFFT